jgi:hypothetical protein
MSFMDWSPPTPRSPQQGRACRQDATRPPVASCRPLTGCMADYDALAEAVRTYRQTYGRKAYEAMRDAAMRCGMPQGEPPLSWSRQRLGTYRHMMENA